MGTLNWKRKPSGLEAVSQSGNFRLRIEAWTDDYRLVVYTSSSDIHDVHMSIRRDKQIECKKLAERLLAVLEAE